MQNVHGAEVVPVVILFWLFVIHVLSEFPDTVSVNVTKLRMVMTKKKLVPFTNFRFRCPPPLENPRCGPVVPPLENPRCGPVPGNRM
jgi:hypothetical protein